MHCNRNQMDENLMQPTTSKKTLYLIDGSSYLYRAFYALGRLTNSRGMPTQAVYGFAQMLTKVMREKKPDYLCVVFDPPGPTHRHAMYELYKATRQKMPEDLQRQIVRAQAPLRAQRLVAA